MPLAGDTREALYASFVLVLVLGLRRGEVLGLARDQVNLDEAELYGEQFQRVRGKPVTKIATGRGAGWAILRSNR
jgi:integrase